MKTINNESLIYSSTAGGVSLMHSSSEDLVGDYYKVHVNDQILELSNEFCKYYGVSKPGESETNYFAIVYDEKFLPPINLIENLASNSILGVNKILSYSISTISATGHEHFVVIVEKYDYNNNLKNHIRKHGKLSQAEIDDLVLRITDIFESLTQVQIFSCSLNAENILFHNGKFHAIREFIDGPASYHQPNQYIAPELLECHKAARESNSIKSEIYALGIVVFYAFTAIEPWEEFSSIMEYNEARLEEGTAKLLTSKVKLTERLRVFLKWTLADNAEYRWVMSYIREWYLDKLPTSNIYDSLSDNKNIIGFNDKNYSSIKSLSYAMFHHWEKSVKFIRDDKIYKWATRENLSHEIIGNIKEIIVNNSGSTISTIHVNYKLGKLLSLLDPYGSIRQPELAFSGVSIPSFLFYLLVANKKEKLELVVKTLKEQMWELYNLDESAGHLPQDTQELIQKHCTNFNASSVAKGFERLVYSLNPGAKCLSKMLNGKYITSVSELVSFLEDQAQDKFTKFSLDKHIVAFIAARLNFKQDIKASVLSNFIRLHEHPSIKNLTIMDIVQQNLPDIQIPNIYTKLSEDITILVEEHLHHVEFKKQIIKAIENVAQDINISKLVRVFSNQQQFVNDHNGYQEACRQVANLENKIKTLATSRESNMKALLIGQKITVLISYILCFIVTITVMI